MSAYCWESANGKYPNGCPPPSGGAEQACGVRFSDPAGSSFGRGGELFVASYGSKEIVHLWLQQAGDGEARGVGGGRGAALEGKLRVDYLPVPGHPAAVCVSPDGQSLAVSIQVEPEPYTLHPTP